MLEPAVWELSAVPVVSAPPVFKAPAPPAVDPLVASVVDAEVFSVLAVAPVVDDVVPELFKPPVPDVDVGLPVVPFAGVPDAVPELRPVPAVEVPVVELVPVVTAVVVRAEVLWVLPLACCSATRPPRKVVRDDAEMLRIAAPTWFPAVAWTMCTFSGLGMSMP